MADLDWWGVVRLQRSSENGSSAIYMELWPVATTNGKETRQQHEECGALRRAAHSGMSVSRSAVQISLAMWVSTTTNIGRL